VGRVEVPFPPCTQVLTNIAHVWTFGTQVLRRMGKRRVLIVGARWQAVILQLRVRFIGSREWFTNGLPGRLLQGRATQRNIAGRIRWLMNHLVWLEYRSGGRCGALRLCTNQLKAEVNIC
jgi:hypothetical protein